MIVCIELYAQYAIHSCQVFTQITMDEGGPNQPNPKVITSYYLECVEQCGGSLYRLFIVVALSFRKHLLIYFLGCPTILRSNYGMENIISRQ